MEAQRARKMTQNRQPRLGVAVAWDTFSFCAGFAAFSGVLDIDERSDGRERAGESEAGAARSDQGAEGSPGEGHSAGELIALQWHCERRACAEVEARRMCRAAHSGRGRMMEDANSALHSVWSQPPPTTSGATRGIPKWHSTRVILTLLAITDILHPSRPVLTYVKDSK